jgi:hypothetical protein
MAKHRLDNATVVGRVLRRVEEYQAQQIALAMSSSAVWYQQFRTVGQASP